MAARKRLRCPTRVVVVGALAISVLAGLAPAAQAGDPSMVLKLTAARHLDGPYSKLLRVNIAEDSSKVVYLKAKTLDGQPEDSRLLHIGESAGHFVKYYREGVNITTQVRSMDGYPFVAKAKAKFFKMKIKRDTGAPDEGCAIVFGEDEAFADADVRVGVNQDPNNCFA